MLIHKPLNYSHNTEDASVFLTNPSTLWVNRKAHQTQEYCESRTMKKFAKTCGLAVVRALLNGVIALALMLVVEFSISGDLEAYPLYVAASVLITLAFFIYQLIVDRRRATQASCAAREAGH